MDPQTIQRLQCLEEEDQPDPGAHEEKESFRWLENLRQATALISNPADCVHIGDRESDIFELFSLADELGTNFLIRTCVDRLAQDGDRPSPRK